MCNSKLNPCDQICKKQVAYDKAVEAYQFHVQRYHTWVNYYAIFVGALFVAFYTIMSQTDFEIYYYCIGDTKFRCELVLPWLIALLGWFASICWLASIIGHCAWMNSWIEIVKKRERNFLDDSDFVYYRIVLSTDQKRKERKMYGGNSDRRRFLPEFISTQKITQIFVSVVIIAWIVVLLFLGLLSNPCWYLFIIGVLFWGGVTVWIRHFLLHRVGGCISSNIDRIEV